MRHTSLSLALAAFAAVGFLGSFARVPSRPVGRSNSIRLGLGGGTSLFASASRLMYVWDNTIPGDGARTSQLLTFCRQNGITSLAVDCAPLGYTAHADGRYLAFVNAMHGRGIEVLALAGDPWWTVACTANLPGQPTCHTEGWDFWRRVATSAVPFDGVLDISEPYLHDPAWFWNNPLAAAQGYVDYIAGVRARIGGLRFYHALPYWYDEDARLSLRLAGSALARPLNQYVQERIDVAVLLENRDEALGADGMVAHSQGELAAGPCIVGVETQDLGAGGDALTFWEEGRNVMERELLRFYLASIANPRLRGFAIHDYASFRSLAP